MSLGKTWYRIEKAVEKFGVGIEQINEWIGEGLVRTEVAADGTSLVNGDDLQLQVEGLVSEMHDDGAHPEVQI